jgi:hypothetical protein
VIGIKKNELQAIQFWLVVALVFFVALNLYLGYSIQRTLSPPAPEEPEKARLEVTLIEAAACEQCADLSTAHEALAPSSGAEVRETRLAGDSSEARKLIARHAITRLPALVITGDTAKLAGQGLRESEGALVYDTALPYLDPATGAVKGLVTVTLLTKPDCTDCVDLAPSVDGLQQQGMVFSERRLLNDTSPEGKALIERYAIARLPTVIFSAGLFEYPFIGPNWPQLGTVESDGMLVLRQVVPPYYALNESRVRGLVQATYLADKSCTSCYNASLHRDILVNSFGIKLSSERSLDIAGTEGKALIAKHNISLAPTVVLAGDLPLYANLAQAWPQVGSKEADGSWVFRRVDLLQGVTYRDLATGETRTVAVQGQ